jgi:hypothetical protein
VIVALVLLSLAAFAQWKAGSKPAALVMGAIVFVLAAGIGAPQ